MILATRYLQMILNKLNKFLVFSLLLKKLLIFQHFVTFTPDVCICSDILYFPESVDSHTIEWGIHDNNDDIGGNKTTVLSFADCNPGKHANVKGYDIPTILILCSFDFWIKHNLAWVTGCFLVGFICIFLKTSEYERCFLLSAICNSGSSLRCCPADTAALEHYGRGRLDFSRKLF